MTGAIIAAINFPMLLSAQDKKVETTNTKETQEIIIRKNGDKEMNLKVEINGDSISVNGKPLSEYKDDDVTINKRKMIIRDGNKNMTFNFRSEDGALLGNGDHMIREFKNGKEISRPFLGVTTEKTSTGAKIIEVVKESSAEKAGLKKDDIITKIGDENIADAESLSKIISAKKPKEVVKVTYSRNGKTNTAKATLGERKVSGDMAFTLRAPKTRVQAFKVPNGGYNAPNMELYDEDMLRNWAPNGGGQNFNFEPFASFPRQKKIGLKIQDTEEGGNVKVIEVEPESAAEKAGIMKDDIITEIGGKKVENTDDAREQLNPEDAKNSYTVKAMRNGKAMSFEIKIPKKLKTANL
ncbi:hypothetical protein BH11BAC3_BH11BAC3_14750 [soil metagenome]